MKQGYLYIFIALLMSLAPAAVSAADQNTYQLQERDRYGWQLMTPQERAEHRNKMRNMKTEQEREAYRLQHHAEMQKRAKERGVTLPDMPRPQGAGRGMGPGTGGGMGPGTGGGMGGGAGR